MPSIEDFIRDLESLNIEDRTWENVSRLIDDYKSKIAENMKFSMEFMSMIMQYNKLKMESETPPITTIRCIFNDTDINIEKCKECTTQCAKYSKVINNT